MTSRKKEDGNSGSRCFHPEKEGEIVGGDELDFIMGGSLSKKKKE